MTIQYEQTKPSSHTTHSMPKLPYKQIKPFKSYHNDNTKSKPFKQYHNDHTNKPNRSNHTIMTTQTKQTIQTIP